jgi:ribose transport system substrate-binding protein
MKDALAKDPDVAGVFACTDPMAVAAANAIKDAGLDPTKDIVTVGYNGDAEALTAIQGGTLSATVAQDPRGMGEISVNLAQQALDGEAITFDNPDEREVFSPVTLITPDNVGDFVK